MALITTLGFFSRHKDSVQVLGVGATLQEIIPANEYLDFHILHIQNPNKVLRKFSMGKYSI